MREDNDGDEDRRPVVLEAEAWLAKLVDSDEKTGEFEDNTSEEDNRQGTVVVVAEVEKRLSGVIEVSEMDFEEGTKFETIDEVDQESVDEEEHESKDEGGRLVVSEEDA